MTSCLPAAKMGLFGAKNNGRINIAFCVTGYYYYTFARIDEHAKKVAGGAFSARRDFRQAGHVLHIQ